MKTEEKKMHISVRKDTPLCQHIKTQETMATKFLFMLTNSISKIVSMSNIEAVNELVISDVWKINVEDIFLVIMKK